MAAVQTGRIIVVADAAFRTSLAERFAHAGAADTIEPGPPDAMEGDWPDAYVIDAAFAPPAPLVERLRAHGFAAPIVLIADAEGAPCPGADAVLIRPLRLDELRGALAAAPLRIGDWRLHGQNLVSPSREQLRLTEKEAAILARLARAGGRPVGRATLLRDVWGYGADLPTRALEAHIYRLRRKLERDPRHPALLQTTPDGYRICAACRD